MNRTPASLETKSHYEILDGLRGVASMMVVIFHVLETYSDENRFKQITNRLPEAL
jgi:peptidoglycan/LPS O-acetylase OafA/YrhL